MVAIRVIDDHIELANIGTNTHAQIEGHIQGIGNYAFPAVDGALNQIIETDGAGALSWVNKPAVFACGDLNACNLTDIGTREHSSITGIGTSDHHVKYTDAEAVSAADASDKFIERNEENVLTQNLIKKRTTTGTFDHYKVEFTGISAIGTLMLAHLKSTSNTYAEMMAMVSFPMIEIEGTDIKKTIGLIRFVKSLGVNNTSLQLVVLDAAGNGINPIEFYHDKIDVKNLPIKDIKNHSTSALSGTKKVIEILIGSTPYYFEVYPTKA